MGVRALVRMGRRYQTHFIRPLPTPSSHRAVSLAPGCSSSVGPPALHWPGVSVSEGAPTGGGVVCTRRAKLASSASTEPSALTVSCTADGGCRGVGERGDSVGRTTRVRHVLCIIWEGRGEVSGPGHAAPGQVQAGRRTPQTCRPVDWHAHTLTKHALAVWQACSHVDETRTGSLAGMPSNQASWWHTYHIRRCLPGGLQCQAEVAAAGRCTQPAPHRLARALHPKGGANLTVSRWFQ